MTETNTSIVTAIARLTRAGSENSGATAKLKDAATTVALLIEKTCPVGVTLPRGYRVTRVRSKVGSEVYLVRESVYDPKLDSSYYDESATELWIDGTGTYLHGDFGAKVPDATRRGALLVAADIAGGLLDEIAEFLEKRQAEAEKAAGILLLVRQELHLLDHARPPVSPLRPRTARGQ